VIDTHTLEDVDISPLEEDSLNKHFTPKANKRCVKCGMLFRKFSNEIVFKDYNCRGVHGDGYLYWHDNKWISLTYYAASIDSYCAFPLEFDDGQDRSCESMVMQEALG